MRRVRIGFFINYRTPRREGWLNACASHSIILSINFGSPFCRPWLLLDPRAFPRPRVNPERIGVRFPSRAQETLLPNPFDVTVAKGLIVTVRRAEGAAGAVVGSPMFLRREHQCVVGRQRTDPIRRLRR